ncbi:hypothetical protein TNCV_4611471 [Trichonephila clavipes]|nr:hypothetical protein TNCV_4611471 [Trichonephila clavipes]
MDGNRMSQADIVRYFNVSSSPTIIYPSDGEVVLCLSALHIILSYKEEEYPLYGGAIPPSQCRTLYRTTICAYPSPPELMTKLCPFILGSRPPRRVMTPFRGAPHSLRNTANSEKADMHLMYGAANGIYGAAPKAVSGTLSK